ncbi:Hypp7454 [Branchiostoma lanceolatum]|uniref:Hypp7454 protein n=2 Tax=Branchiostoma lanceolatum TaxID=7740 RepID=A0A8K0E9G4_BRALA|nr:Hypp7454 [Branchiostoma lanceolatum]
MEVNINNLTALVSVSGLAPSPVPEKVPVGPPKPDNGEEPKNPATSNGPTEAVNTSEQHLETMPPKLQEFSFEQAEKSRPPTNYLAYQRPGYMPVSRMYWRLPSYRQTPGKGDKDLTSATSSISILSWLSELEDAVEMSTSTTSVSHGEQQGMFPPGKTLGLQVPHVKDLGNSCEQQQGPVAGSRQCGNPEKRTANSHRDDQDCLKDSSFITHDNSYLSNTTPPLTHPAFQGKRGFDPWKRRIEFNRAHYPVSVRHTRSDLRHPGPQLQNQETARKLSKVTSAPMVIKQIEPLPRDSNENLIESARENMTPVETVKREESHRSECQGGGNASPWMCENCCERERKTQKIDGCQGKQQQGGRSSLKTAKIWIGRKMLPSVPRYTIMNVVPFENRLVKKS